MFARPGLTAAHCDEFQVVFWAQSTSRRAARLWAAVEEEPPSDWNDAAPVLFRTDYRRGDNRYLAGGLLGHDGERLWVSLTYFPGDFSESHPHTMRPITALARALRAVEVSEITGGLSATFSYPLTEWTSRLSLPRQLRDRSPYNTLDGLVLARVSEEQMMERATLFISPERDRLVHGLAMQVVTKDLPDASHIRWLFNYTRRNSESLVERIEV